MVTKFVSVFSVVDKLYRDYGSKEDLPIWDIIEWAGEALDHIHAAPQYKEYRDCKVTVEDYKVTLPCTLVNFRGARRNYVPMVESPYLYTMKPSEPSTASNATIGLEEVTSDNMSQLSTSDDLITYSYYIDNGVLYTDLQEGEITISYKGIHVDEDGYPMIPDSIAYTQAVSAYCQMMLDRREWRAGLISEAVYRDTERLWKRSVRYARGRANFPSIDKAEVIKRMWTRLRPVQNAHNSSFGGLIAPNGVS